MHSAHYTMLFVPIIITFFLDDFRNHPDPHFFTGHTGHKGTSSGYWATVYLHK